MLNGYVHHHRLVLCFTLFCLGTSLAFWLLPREVFPGYIHHPRFVALTALLAPLCVIAPRFLLSTDSLEKKAATYELELALVMAFVVNGAGELGLFELYKYGLPYDKFAHFFVSLIFGYVLGLQLFVRTKLSRISILGTVLISIFVLGLVWEGTEALSDLFFHTRLWGIYGTLTTADTLMDILANTLGVIFSCYLIARSQKDSRR